MNRTDYAYLRDYDDRGQRADARNRDAERIAVQFMTAIHRNEPATPTIEMGVHGSDTLTAALMDALYVDTLAAGLVNVLHLCHEGRYEASSKALIEWMGAASLAHGIETAELRSVLE